MSITIEAIYEAGLLRPLEPLNALAERARVRVTIETSVASDPAAVPEERGPASAIVPFTVHARPLGMHPGLNYGSTGRLLEEIEGSTAR